jgi:FAD/FMN-containing dehydrogenase
MLTKKRNEKWENWAGNHSCQAEWFFEPSSEREIRDCVGLAQKGKKRIRVVGSGHSFSPIAIGNHILISLENYAKVLEVGPDFVRVQGGIKLKELYETLSQNNLALPNYGVINKQSLAGALATGTHGSGKNIRSLSANIRSLKLILANGNICEIDRDSKIIIDGESFNLWQAASISLGMLGVVSEVVMECVPQYSLKSEELQISFEEYVDSANLLANNFEYFKAWWFPHTGKVHLFKTQLLDESDVIESQKEIRYSEAQKKRDSELDAFSGPLFEQSLHQMDMIPEINQRCLDDFFSSRIKVDTAVNILVHDETVPMIVSEFAVPIGDHLKALVAFKKALENEELYLHFPVDLRFSAAEESWLSPAFQQDVFYIGICIRAYKKKEIPKVMKLFFGIMNEYKARPNWGKLFDADQLKFVELYPKWEDFRKLKKELDPKDVFLNDDLKQWFNF